MATEITSGLNRRRALARGAYLRCAFEDGGRDHGRNGVWGPRPARFRMPTLGVNTAYPSSLGRILLVERKLAIRILARALDTGRRWDGRTRFLFEQKNLR